MPRRFMTHKILSVALAAALVLAGFAPSFASKEAAVPKSALKACGHGEKVAVEASWLHGILLGELKSRVQGEALRVEFDPKEPEEDVVLGARPARYRVVPAGRITSGRVCRIRVELLSKEGRVIEGVWVSGEVRVFRPVWVAREDMESGRQLRTRDIKKEVRDVRQVPYGSLDDPGKVIGLRAKRSLVAGTILREDQFKSAALVKRGQKVRILLEKGALRITAPGQALERGESGDLVQVMNLSSRKIVLARVADHETVVVEF